MLLFQNLTAHFFFYPVRPKYINMHYVFWAIFALMLLYAAFFRARPRPVEAVPGSNDEPEARFTTLGWLAAAVAVMGIVVFLAGYVNNDENDADSEHALAGLGVAGRALSGTTGDAVTTDRAAISSDEKLPRIIQGPHDGALKASWTSASAGRSNCMMT